MKKLLIAVSALTSAMALGAAEYSALSFSTVGPDTYADGTTVKDGECYALVWTADGNFDGLKVDGTVVDANDKLLVAVPFAKNGACEPVVFNIEEGLVSGGQFGVYLLDTRKFDANGQATVMGVNASGKLTYVNSAKLVQGEVKVASANGGTPASGAANAAVSGEGAVLTDLGPVAQPRITDISFLGDNVVLTVEDADGRANWAAQVGETPAADGTVGQAVGGGKTIKVVAPKTSGKTSFFKVIRK